MTDSQAPAASSQPGDLFHLIVDTVPHLMWTAGPDGRIDYRNTRIYEYLGADKAALDDRGFGHVIHPDDLQSGKELWTRALASGEPAHVEVRVRRADGVYRWHHVIALPLRDRNGALVRWLGTSTDIQDELDQRLTLEAMVRARTRALHDSEQRFRLFMDNYPGTAWIKDSRLRYQYRNKLCDDASGRRTEHALGRDDFEIWPPEVAKSLRENDERALSRNEPLQTVESVSGAHGQAARWLVVKFPLADASGAMGVAGMGIDITERHQLEQALRQSEQRFQTFMDLSPAMAWIKDADHRITYANATVQKLLKKNSGELIGRLSSEFWPEDVAEAVRKAEDQVLRTGGVLQTIHTLPSGPAGEAEQWLIIRCPLPDASGRPGIGAVAIDITAQKRAERHLEQSANRVRGLLGRLVATQEAERHRVAIELHDLIGQNLTALGIELGVVHDALPAQSKQRLTARFDSMRRLLDATITSIRDVMSELRPPELDEFGLLPALHRYADEFERRTGLKTRTVWAGNTRRLPREFDLALFRIVQEALTNAAKHSGGTEATITVSEGRGRLRMTIEDNGGGFVSPEGARSAGRGGWGLPAMRERAEARGGWLRVEFPAKGTRVVVEMPLSDNERDAYPDSPG